MLAQETIDMIQYLASFGLSNREIAEQAKCSRESVAKYRDWIDPIIGQHFGKLTVEKRVEKPTTTTQAGSFYRCKCECGRYTITNKNELLRKSHPTRSCGHCINEKNELGNRYGELLVVDGMIINNHRYWLCQCNCGNYITIRGNKLRENRKSCGCARPDYADITNQRFGKLVALEPDDTVKNTSRTLFWKCKCDCGSIKTINGSDLRSGKISSCGCMISKGEYDIRYWLNEHDISYQTQYTYDDLLSDKGKKLRFDFAIFNNNELLFLLEYQGIQHFDSNNRFYSEDGVKHDNMKLEYCKKNNIPLVYINYNDNIETILSQILVEDE